MPEIKIEVICGKRGYYGQIEDIWVATNVPDSTTYDGLRRCQVIFGRAGDPYEKWRSPKPDEYPIPEDYYQALKDTARRVFRNEIKDVPLIPGGDE